MTPLRLQMIEDMKSAGLAPRTQAVYIDAVRRLAGHYRRSPDRLTEEEFLHRLRDAKTLKSFLSRYVTRNL